MLAASGEVQSGRGDRDRRSGVRPAAPRAGVRGRPAQQFGVGRIQRPGHFERRDTGPGARRAGRPDRGRRRAVPAAGQDIAAVRAGRDATPADRAARRSASRSRPGSGPAGAPAHRRSPARGSGAANSSRSFIGGRRILGVAGGRCGHRRQSAGRRAAVCCNAACNLLRPCAHPRYSARRRAIRARRATGSPS